MPFFAPYLKEDDLTSLCQYKYSSGEYTYLDRFLNTYWWTPLAAIIPRNIAANTLTVLGFICSGIALGVTLYYSPRLDSEIPPNAHLFIALMIFGYQTLDAMDGKQARATGMSSPLGTLLDHGCDVLTTSFFAIVQLGCFHLGVTKLTMASYICSTHMLQYICIWYEFYFKVFMHSSNKFIGVTEVQFFIIFWQIMRGIGSTWFDATFFGLTLGEFLSWCLMANSLGVVVSYGLKGMHHLYYRSVEEKNSKIFTKAAAQLIVSMGFLVVEYFFAVTSVIYGHADAVLVLLCCCLCHSTVCIRFILASCSEKNFRAIQWPILPLLFISLLLVFFNILPHKAQLWLWDLREFATNHTNTVVVITTLVEAFYFIDFVVESVKGMARVLGVSVFTVTPLKKVD